MVWPSIWVVTCQSMSISRFCARPSAMRLSTRHIQPMPSRQGVHWPQLSWAKKRQLLCRKSTIEYVSSNTTAHAVPSPRQPTFIGAEKSSFVSSSSAVISPVLSPPGTTAFALRFFQTPRPNSSINSLAVMPSGAS